MEQFKQQTQKSIETQGQEVLQYLRNTIPKNEQEKAEYRKKYIELAKLTGKSKQEISFSEEEAKEFDNRASVGY